MRSKSLSVLLVSVAIAACSGDDKSPSDEPGDASHADGSIADGGNNTVDAGGMDAASALDAASGASDGQVAPTDSASPFPRNDAGQVLCGTAPCGCSDGIDNDTDGVIDTDDPECVSAWDNDEASFGTGIPGDNRGEACQDCFFDGNSGPGNDGCRIPSSCLTTGDPSSGQGSCNSCTASDECKNFCRAYTPNGCDCFGCCSVQLGSNVTQHVLLGDGCNIDGSQVTGCTSCVPSDSCVNSCGRCELCPGKTLADLPADCGAPSPGDGGVGTSDAGTVMPTPSCDEGEARCGAGLPACIFGEACTFGCCVRVPLL